MTRSVLAAAISLSLLALADAAPAATVVAGACEDLSGSSTQNTLNDGNTDRCLFEGNITGNANAGNENSFLSAQASYNALALGDIKLDFITSSDAGDFGSFGSITGAGSTSGTFNLPGFGVNFLAVKAGSQFFIYQLDGGSSGSFTTAGLNNNQGRPRDLSHLAFFGTRNATAVPEPGTWAMMIGGFGLVGGALRRARRDAGRAALASA